MLGEEMHARPVRLEDHDMTCEKACSETIRRLHMSNDENHGRSSVHARVEHSSIRPHHVSAEHTAQRNPRFNNMAVMAIVDTMASETREQIIHL